MGGLALHPILQSEGITDNSGSITLGIIKHGHNRHHKPTPEYRSWMSMISRTSNHGILYYGERGISVCDRWRQSFQNFLQDMGRRPKGHTLDRIDNSMGYSPENCRWATLTQQMRNTRRNRMIECRGEKKLLIEWSEISPVPYKIIHQRLQKGWSAENAIFTPPHGTRRKDHPEYKGPNNAHGKSSLE